MPAKLNNPYAPAIAPAAGTLDPVSLSVPVARTTSFDGSAIDFLNAGPEDMSATLFLGAVSGTTPTLAAKVQESADGSTNWVDVKSFTQQTTSNGLETVRFTRKKRYLRVSTTIAGTTPSFMMGVLVGR